MDLTKLKIKKNKLLIVEGSDEEDIFNKICVDFNLESIQVLPIGGKDNFRKQLPILVKDADFDKVDSIGIVRDADTNFASAFDSVCNTLRNSRLSQPIKPMIASDARPKTTIFITPDNKSNGALETLFLQTVANNPLMSCVNGYFDCIKDKQGEIPDSGKLDIAKIYVFLASHPKYLRLRLGHTVLKGYWELSHNNFDEIIKFLRGL